jgi:7-carboxy-7-deazaguanine synthase|tara:strand:+ start:1963 stop:2856 length:894 start_codon:yes stop_codon:yes gene_type:complete
MSKAKEYSYSEIFYSMQGEGVYTGEPTAWLRFFLCNLQCDGFGQKDPTDPSTYILDYENIDPSQYKRIEDLPVFARGCDSSYSWSKKFKGLQHKDTVAVIAEKILDRIPNRNFDNNIHMCFTGGEPLMRHAQLGSAEVMEYLGSIDQVVPSVTYETNGTQALTSEFATYWYNKQETTELFFSVSPKLWTVAGELREKAIKVDIVKTYWDLSPHGQLKFVCNGTDKAWQEIEEVVKMFRAAGVMYPIWIMPLGGTIEGQKGEVEGHIPANVIADETLARGYRVAARVHAYLWENIIGK